MQVEEKNASPQGNIKAEAAPPPHFHTSSPPNLSLFPLFQQQLFEKSFSLHLYPYDIESFGQAGRTDLTGCAPRA
jgi:hypothetical protein